MRAWWNGQHEPLLEAINAISKPINSFVNPSPKANLFGGELGGVSQGINLRVEFGQRAAELGEGFLFFLLNRRKTADCVVAELRDACPKFLVTVFAHRNFGIDAVGQKNGEYDQKRSVQPGVAVAVEPFENIHGQSIANIDAHELRHNDTFFGNMW